MPWRTGILAHLTSTREGRSPPERHADEANFRALEAPATPGFRHYAAAREAITHHAWRSAQRLLEIAMRDEPDSPAGPDLDSVRAVRRNLERLARWPSNPDAHLALGIAYFELELGDDALAEFGRVQRLAPQRHEGFALAALEYLYRKDYAQSLQAWQQARARNRELAPFGEILPPDHVGG